MKIKTLEKILKSFANRRRLAIMKQLLSHKEITVSEIAKNIHLSFKATSKHLAILRHLDIIENRQQSLQVYYRLGGAFPKIVNDLIKHISNSRE